MSSKEIGRRNFLKKVGLATAGFLLNSCRIEPISNSDPKQEGGENKGPTVSPSPYKLVKPVRVESYLTSALDPFPVEAPNKAVSPEVLEEKWRKIWVLGRGESTGGAKENLPEKDRWGNFLERLTKQWEQKGETLAQAELFVGAFPQIKENEQGKPDLQSVESQAEDNLRAFVLIKGDEEKIYYASEEKGSSEIKIEAIPDLFTPEPKIWGSGCQQKVESSLLISCPDGLAYRREKTTFGADLSRLIPVAVGEKGEFSEIAEGKFMVGYLFTAAPLNEEQSLPETFFLSFKEEEKLPHLPAGKEKLDQDQFITAFDLKTAKWYVWENSKENNYPYVGFWDLERGAWQGEGAYQGEEGYEKLFESSPAPIETPLPTIALREVMPETSLPIDHQAYSLSCELAAAEITVLWYNQAIAGGKIALPEGFKTFEDFFIAEAGLADNPVEGYCGAVNGWLSTSCDASSGAGYGVYNEPLLNGYRKLGIPAEAITIKDLDNGKEQLKQVLIDSYYNNQALCLWGRWNEKPVEWRTNPRTGEQYPMAYGEHCVAGRVMSVDDGNFLIEISDPLPYGSGSKKVYTFDTLAQWMRGVGWFLAVKVG